MPRIFACLAIANLLVVSGAAVFGVAADRVSADRHVLLAVFSLLISCAIQVLVFTYLTVTGKMVSQALHVAHLDLGPLQDVRRLKRKTTLHMALLVVGVVFVAATGGAKWGGGPSNVLHFSAAGVLLLLHPMILFLEYGTVVRNAALVAGALDSYSRWRQRIDAGASAMKSEGAKLAPGVGETTSD